MMVRQPQSTRMILATAIAVLVSTSTRRTRAFSNRPQLPPARAVSVHESGRARSTRLHMAQKMTPTRKTRREDSFDRDAEDNDETEDEITLDFSDAQAKIAEAENTRRVEEGLTVGLTEEDAKEFNSKKDQYEDMRSKIRARASSEGIEKSVATRQMIEEATRRAKARETPATDSLLDLSGFGDALLDDETDELTEDERAEIDKIANMPLLEQLKEEFSNTRFPTLLVVFQTAAAMGVIFFLSATAILKGDVAIRQLYIDYGLIPNPNGVFEYSGLNLPDGFFDDDAGSVIQKATDAVDQIISPK